MHTLFVVAARDRTRLIEHVRNKRTLALGGIIGPWLWMIIVLVLTVFEFDTLTSFGWTPGQDNGVNYPSSLALGRLGWIQMLNFAMLGACTIGLAAGLYGVVQPGRRARLGPVLLGLAGVGLLFTGFPTDHGPADAEATWHGVIHAIGFGLAFLLLLLAFFCMPVSFRGDERWRGDQWLFPALGFLVVATGAFGSLALPEALNQVSFYVSLIVVLVGLSLMGLRLRKLLLAPKPAVRNT